jgi:HPr kinase/phosphorylase
MTPSSPSVTVGTLLRVRPEVLNLGIELLAGRCGLDRMVTSPRVQKTGLALAGFDNYLQPGRVLIFGQSEISYLRSLTEDARRASLARAFRHPIPCVLVTGGQRVPEELTGEAERACVPALGTALTTPIAITKLEGYLEDILAERTVLHAVLMDILGLGVLITGESGIGKSECAMDLILRGHRLVADDTVEVRRRAEAVLIGTCPEMTRHHMEIRGLGLINVRDLFGVASTRTSKRVELVVRLERWEAGREYERLGLDDVFEEVLGLRIPLITMPVAPGRSVANLVEVAARNQLLRSRGHHAARRLVAKIDRQLREGAEPGPSTDEPPEDFEQEDA